MEEIREITMSIPGSLNEKILGTIERLLIIPWFDSAFFPSEATPLEINSKHRVARSINRLISYNYFENKLFENKLLTQIEHEFCQNRFQDLEMCEEISNFLIKKFETVEIKIRKKYLELFNTYIINQNLNTGLCVVISKFLKEEFKSKKKEVEARKQIFETFNEIQKNYSDLVDKNVIYTIMMIGYQNELFEIIKLILPKSSRLYLFKSLRRKLLRTLNNKEKIKIDIKQILDADTKFNIKRKISKKQKIYYEVDICFIRPCNYLIEFLKIFDENWDENAIILKKNKIGQELFQEIMKDLRKNL